MSGYDFCGIHTGRMEERGGGKDEREGRMKGRKDGGERRIKGRKDGGEGRMEERE